MDLSYIFSALILALSFPGVLCETTDHSVTGLVIASIIALLCLLAVFAMIIVITMWRDWYMERQAQRGIRRIPRDLDGARGLMSIFRGPSREMNGGPAYIGINGHKPGTLPSQPNAEKWLTTLPEPAPYEERGQTMEFGEEGDEAIEMTTAQNSQVPPQPPMYTTEVHNLRTTTPTHIVAPLEDSYDTRQPVYATAHKEPTYATTHQTAEDTFYIPISGKRPASPQLRPTSSGSNVIRYEAVHVRASTASNMTRPITGESIVITPSVPTAQNPIVVNGEPSVAVYADSNDDAGFTPNRQTDVLF